MGDAERTRRNERREVVTIEPPSFQDLQRTISELNQRTAGNRNVEQWNTAIRGLESYNDIVQKLVQLLTLFRVLTTENPAQLSSDQRFGLTTQEFTNLRAQMLEYFQNTAGGPLSILSQALIVPLDRFNQSLGTRLEESRIRINYINEGRREFLRSVLEDIIQPGMLNNEVPYQPLRVLPTPRRQISNVIRYILEGRILIERQIYEGTRPATPPFQFTVTSPLVGPGTVIPVSTRGDTTTVFYISNAPSPDLDSYFPTPSERNIYAQTLVRVRQALDDISRGDTPGLSDQQMIDQLRSGISNIDHPDLNDSIQTVNQILVQAQEALRAGNRQLTLQRLNEAVRGLRNINQLNTPLEEISGLFEIHLSNQMIITGSANARFEIFFRGNARQDFDIFRRGGAVNFGGLRPLYLAFIFSHVWGQLEASIRPRTPNQVTLPPNATRTIPVDATRLAGGFEFGMGVGPTVVRTTLELSYVDVDTGQIRLPLEFRDQRSRLAQLSQKPVLLIGNMEVLLPGRVPVLRELGLRGVGTRLFFQFSDVPRDRNNVLGWTGYILLGHEWFTGQSTRLSAYVRPEVGSMLGRLYYGGELDLQGTWRPGRVVQFRTGLQGRVQNAPGRGQILATTGEVEETYIVYLGAQAGVDLNFPNSILSGVSLTVGGGGVGEVGRTSGDLGRIVPTFSTSLTLTSGGQEHREERPRPRGVQMPSAVVSAYEDLRRDAMNRQTALATLRAEVQRLANTLQSLNLTGLLPQNVSIGGVNRLVTDLRRISMITDGQQFRSALRQQLGSIGTALGVEAFSSSTPRTRPPAGES